MVLTASTMLGLGTEAPDFQLPDVTTGETVSLDSFSGNKALLVMFICKHCPYVVHVQGSWPGWGTSTSRETWAWWPSVPTTWMPTRETPPAS